MAKRPNKPTVADISSVRRLIKVISGFLRAMPAWVQALALGWAVLLPLILLMVIWPLLFWLVLGAAMASGMAFGLGLGIMAAYNGYKDAFHD